MSGDRHRRVNEARRQRRDRGGAGWATRVRARTGARLGLVVFALALLMALGAVVTLIAAGSVQALPQAAVLHAKADGWVGLAATVSVLVSAGVGLMLVQRYFTSRRR